MLSFGTPLPGFADANDREEEQQEIMEEWTLRVEQRLFDYFRMKKGAPPHTLAREHTARQQPSAMHHEKQPTLAPKLPSHRHQPQPCTGPQPHLSPNPPLQASSTRPTVTLRRQQVCA